MSEASEAAEEPSSPAPLRKCPEVSRPRPASALGGHCPLGAGPYTLVTLSAEAKHDPLGPL